MPRKRRGGEEQTDTVVNTKKRATKTPSVVENDAAKVSKKCTKDLRKASVNNRKTVKKVPILKSIDDAKNDDRERSSTLRNKPVEAKKRKIIELTSTCCPSPRTKTPKIMVVSPVPSKPSTTLTKTSPYFGKTETKSNSSKDLPLKCHKTPKKKHVESASKIDQSPKKDILSSFMSFEEKSPVKSGKTPTKEEKLEMMKNYMGEKFGKESESSSEEGSDWEEVAEMPHFSEPLPEKKDERTVQVVVEAPDPLGLNKKKKKNSAEEMYARLWNKYIRELRLDMHKAHLLCLLALGLRRNALCTNRQLKAYALSTVPAQYLELNDRTNKKQKQTGLGRVFVNKILRWFVNEFQVDDTVKTEAITSQVLQKRFETKKVASSSELLYLIILILRAVLVECRLCINLKPISKKLPGKTTTKTAMRQAKKAVEQKKAISSKNVAKPKNNNRRKKASKVIECSSSSDEEVQEIRHSKRSKKGDCSNQSVHISSDDSDFEASPLPSKATKKSLTVTKGAKKIVSSDSEDSVIVTKAKVVEKGIDEWLEVYIEQETQWITVDCTEPKFDCTNRIEMNATKPIIYVLGFDSKNYVKDLTARYNSHYSTESRRLRVDDDWWSETLLTYSAPVNEKTSLENAQITAQVLKRPFPSKLDEFKNHPLYALERHLKKFEAIYPPSAVPLGYAKNREPIYARECVKELHSRNNWLKEARLVRIDEKPYKIVKARKNFRKPTLPGQDEKLDLFGLWQTEEYIPPVAHEGRVPKNEYGNVDMYKPSMLPIGCVHLRLPGLNKVAKKLGKDVAPAMTGWDVHGGWSHPVLDGFIVCEEDEDVLIAAWDEEQEALKAKERAKREQVIWGHWKLLIKGVLIRERLKNRYDLTEKKDVASTSHKKKNVVNLHLSFPACREQATKNDHKDTSHLFPFEKI